jgi:uncharacterized protein
MGEPSQDPSMEEILASIKRVIAEDEDAVLHRGRRGRARGRDSEDVLELRNPVDAEDGLLDGDKAEASRNRLAALAAAREQGEAVGDGPLEAVVREMLRPMLKQWLDDNLPEIVEEMVTREIARISGKPI